MPDIPPDTPLAMPLYDQVLAHALDEYPREACGLLARNARGKLVYHRCRNIAPAQAAQDSFQVHPQDWAAVEEHSREIVAVVHSHPDASAEPSDADRVMCERSGLAWYVIAVPGGVVCKIEPAPLPLVGRNFHHGVVDCYTLIRDYYRQVLATELPDFERSDDWWVRREDLYRKNFATAGFVDQGGPEEAEIREHDVLLIQVHADEPNHAAIYVGEQKMLHHLFHRLSGHDVWGGYWLRHCTNVLRHGSLL